ncbi:MAG: PIN domain-containing protein [Nitrospirae bacterium]|nr:PIN domain-containing protein [Candidatus Troglogloeales bacterium]
MVAADTSAWIDYARGTASPMAHKLENALLDGTLVIPLPVLYEVLSGPGLTQTAETAILTLPQLNLWIGFWERAAIMRRKLLQRGQKARSMDCMIAQNCIDHDIALITTDTDYRHFRSFGLRHA